MPYIFLKGNIDQINHFAFHLSYYDEERAYELNLVYTIRKTGVLEPMLKTKTPKMATKLLTDNGQLPMYVAMVYV